MRKLILMSVLIFSPALAKADTLKLNDNSSVNGLVLYHSNTFQLTGEFKTVGGNETKTFQIKRDKVKSVEINDRRDNQGPPPPGINKYEVPVEHRLLFSKNGKEDSFRTGTKIYPPRNKLGAQELGGQDVVTLTNYSTQSGKLVSMSTSTIELHSQVRIGRAQVLSIKVGGKY